MKCKNRITNKDIEVRNLVTSTWYTVYTTFLSLQTSAWSTDS